MSDGIFTDLTSHHIEGIAREGHTPFAVPLISHIEGNLFTGGCIDSVPLPESIQHVVSLYPWEAYHLHHGVLSVVAVKLYDGPEVPDVPQIHALAEWINVCLSHGPTLVHCQAGLNRSGLLGSLALIKGGRTPDEAIALLREKRSPAVLCNTAFERYLRSIT